MWEYLTRAINLANARGNVPDATLNDLGAEGWELVHVERGEYSWARSYLLKRPKRMPSEQR